MIFKSTRFFSAALFLMWLSSACAQKFFVDSNGNDLNPGTEKFPVKSLHAAQILVRNYKSINEVPDSGIQVIIRGGYYDLPQSLVFDAFEHNKHNL
jgi:hypothetical protein